MVRSSLILGNLFFIWNHKKLGGLLESRNELLKYEYIEMVRRGMEDEHLLYLLSDPQEGNITKKAKDHLKAKLNKKILENADIN